MEALALVGLLVVLFVVIDRAMKLPTRPRGPRERASRSGIPRRPPAAIPSGVTARLRRRFRVHILWGEVTGDRLRSVASGARLQAGAGSSA
jgi:hypothetical protein